MGLASKLQQAQQLTGAANAALGAVSGPKPGGYGAPYGAQGAYGARPTGAYPGQAPPTGGYPGQAPPCGGQAHGMPGQYPGQAPPAGQYGAAQPGAYGAPPPQQHQQVGSYGAPAGQQPGAYGTPPPQGLPGSYGAPVGQQAYGAAGQAGGMGGVIGNKLRQMVQVNRLEAFYPPQVLDQVIGKVSNIDFRGLAARYSMPVELATDLTTLALYDVIIYCDDSGSMAFEEGGDRINDLKLILGRVADVATLFDDNGVNIRFMNGRVEGNNVRSNSDAANLVSQVNFTGLTPLGTSLDAKVIRPFLAGPVQSGQLQKPLLIISITDGEPAGEPPQAVHNVIKGAKALVSNSRYGPGAVAFEFAQVGKDQKAQAFLATLDKDPEVGKMVDATSYYELEAEEYSRKGINLTPDVWLVKLMVGAIDPTFDEQD